MSNYLAAYSLSISDLILDKEFVKAYGENDSVKIKEILWKYGIDTKTKEFTEVQCKHRNLQNKVVDCTRYQGGERCDSQWLNSGMASVYAKIEASNHGNAFKGEMLAMIHQGSTLATKEWDDEGLYNSEKVKEK